MASQLAEGKWITIECTTPIIGKTIKITTAYPTSLFFSRIKVSGFNEGYESQLSYQIMLNKQDEVFKNYKIGSCFQIKAKASLTSQTNQLFLQDVKIELFDKGNELFKYERDTKIVT